MSVMAARKCSVYPVVFNFFLDAFHNVRCDACDGSVGESLEVSPIQNKRSSEVDTPQHLISEYLQQVQTKEMQRISTLVTVNPASGHDPYLCPIRSNRKQARRMRPQERVGQALDGVDAGCSSEVSPHLSALRVVE